MDVVRCRLSINSSVRKVMAADAETLWTLIAVSAIMAAVFHAWKEVGRDRIAVAIIGEGSSFWDSYASALRDSLREMRIPATVCRIDGESGEHPRPDAGSLFASNVPGWGVDLRGLLCLGAVAFKEAGNIVTPPGYGLREEELLSAVRHNGSTLNAPESVVDAGRKTYYLDCRPSPGDEPQGIHVIVRDFARNQGRMAAVWLRERLPREPVR